MKKKKKHGLKTRTKDDDMDRCFQFAPTVMNHESLEIDGSLLPQLIILAQCVLRTFTLKNITNENSWREPKH